MPLELNFYYCNEAEQYSLYRIPKALFTDSELKSVSIESKVLYGLLLDRMGLSVQLFAELDKENGIGLIERKKWGKGKPTKIYVKNFITYPDAKALENGKSETAPRKF